MAINAHIINHRCLKFCTPSPRSTAGPRRASFALRRGTRPTSDASAGPLRTSFALRCGTRPTYGTRVDPARADGGKLAHCHAGAAVVTYASALTSAGPEDPALCAGSKPAFAKATAVRRSCSDGEEIRPAHRSGRRHRSGCVRGRPLCRAAKPPAGTLQYPGAPCHADGRLRAAVARSLLPRLP